MGHMKRAEAREAEARLDRECPHRVAMRYEVVFGQWRVILSEGSRTLFTGLYDNPARVEELAERGHAFRCLADRQGFAFGLRNQCGRIDLHLSDEQYAKLLQSRR